MENEMIEKIKVSIKNIDEKLNRIYFFVQDTKGNAKASIRYIYEMALTLKDNGHNVIMLYEKKEYTPVTSWLKGSYDELQHQSLEGQNLAIAPEDVLVIPEIFGFIMEQVKNLPCGKIVLCQAYDHILETLSPGGTWEQYGFFKCITTSEEQKDYINSLMRHVSVDIIEPTLHENFESSKFPELPCSISASNLANWLPSVEEKLTNTLTVSGIAVELPVLLTIENANLSSSIGEFLEKSTFAPVKRM